MWKWIFGGVGTAAEKIGEAVNKNIRTLKGDKAEEAAAVHDEQMAVLAEHAAEFVSRPTRTKWDSFVDGLNRLPRPLITLWVCAFFVWPFFSPNSFLEYILSMELVPESMWLIFMTILGFYFGGRVLSQDIKPPRLSEHQRDYALRQIEKREKAIIEARTPLVVEVAPTRKPPPPAWAVSDVTRKPLPAPPRLPPGVPVPVVKGRPVVIDKMIADLIKREGGYVNDPDDSGGPTNYGITQGTLSAWAAKDATIDDVKAINKETAAEIYRAEYYFGPSIDSLPTALQAHVMDIGVNCGQRTGVRMLQQALNCLGAGIKEDGIVGPTTRAACNDYLAKDIHNALVGVRIKYYEELAGRRPKDRKFLASWKRRAKSFAAV